MSPTSSEARVRPNTAFRRAFAITTSGLVVLCLALVGLGYLQGPRLQGGQVDAAAVTSTPGAQLRLFVNQTVAQVEPEQVTVQPDVPVTVTTAGDVVAVQFDELLDYGTEYRVTVENVTSPYLAQPSTLDYRFTTTSPQIAWLDRGEPDDAIRRSTLDGSGGELLYSAPGIQDFELLDRVLAVATLDGDRASALDLVDLEGLAVERIPLPEPGAVQALQSSGSVLGFTLTAAQAGASAANNSTLYRMDLAGDRALQPVLGLDGEPIRTLGWGFLPGGTNLVALTFDGTLLLVADGVVTPLGQYQEFMSVSVGGGSVVVVQPLGPIVLSLADGSEEPIDPSPIDGETPFSGHTQLLPDGSRVGKAVLVDETNTRFTTLLVRDDGTEASVLYRTPDDRGSIGEFSISPNGQYVAIEVVPDVASSVSDGYYYDARSSSVTTVIVDARTGEQVRSMEGFGLLWD